MTDYINLPGPHGTCLHVDEYGTKYNRKECLILCRLKFIVKQCNCRPLGYTPGQTDIRVCSPRKSGGCVKNAIQAYRSSDSSSMCDCPTPCNESTYTTSLSMSVFPSDIVSREYEDKLLNGKISVNESDTNSTPFDLRKNLVYLDIFYNELSVTQFIQVPSMTWSELLADLGGQMGLFLGMSVITAAEVIEYLVRKVYHLLKGGQSNDKVIALPET